MHRHNLFDDLPRGQEAVSEAERLVLDLADEVYAHTPLKPISKTLYLLTRCLFLSGVRGGVRADNLVEEYRSLRAETGAADLADDFDFAEVVRDCGDRLPAVLSTIDRVRELTADADSLGLVMNALLRGKYQAGEGMGTHLTPEEVVGPVCDMLVAAGEPGDGGCGLFGDICGGTGRFVYGLTRRLREEGYGAAEVARSARLFDQSTVSVDLARLNFLAESVRPDFGRTDDSLTDPVVGEYSGRFRLLATNPPFGARKYRCHAGLEDALSPQILRAAGVKRGGKADPALLFVFRNLDLLADGGAAAIVLPDGVLHAADLRNGIDAYRKVRGAEIGVAAVVSLPTTTFSLGGTVAKTSVVIFVKGRRPDRTFTAKAEHVGFVKRGRKRVPDPAGNDLVEIAAAFRSRRDARFGPPWGQGPAVTAHDASQERVCDLADAVRDYRSDPGHADFHVSILDVDETGTVDVVTASGNRPTTKGLNCRPGDILLSCINPKIWRVCVVPDLAGSTSCSPEFVVLRPQDGVDPWRLAARMHHPDVRAAVLKLARGTSSSRQRVEKGEVPGVPLPKVETPGDFVGYGRWREETYRLRLLEARAVRSVREGGPFSWDADGRR